MESDARYHEMAAEYGIKYLGPQSFLHHGSLPLFQDSVTGSTFVKEDHETLAEAIERKRKQFAINHPAPRQGREFILVADKPTEMVILSHPGLTDEQRCDVLQDLRSKAGKPVRDIHERSQS